MTYISVNVGHSNLNFDMEVNVIYRCHMSPAKLKYLFKGKYRSIGSGVSPVKFFNVQVYAIFRNLGSTGHIDFISIN